MRTIPWGVFSEKHKRYILNSINNKMNVAEGSIRAGKTIDNCVAVAIELETHPDKLHLASGSSLPNAKLNIGDCNGFGLEHLFKGRCHWGKYKSNEALYISTKTGEKIPTDIEGVDRRAYIYRIAEKVMSQVNPEDSDEVVQMMPWGLYHNAQPVKKEYYENRTEIPYEFDKVFVPLKYNYVAKRQYGDYMKVVKGFAGHNYPYFESQHKKLWINITELITNKDKLEKKPWQKRCNPGFPFLPINWLVSPMVKQYANDYCGQQNPMVVRVE